MYNLLLTILLVLSVVIVIAIFMQPTKNQSSNVFDASSWLICLKRSKGHAVSKL